MLPILFSHRPQGLNEEKRDPAIVVTAHGQHEQVSQQSSSTFDEGISAELEINF